MELKCLSARLLIIFKLCSNRTFMELKFGNVTTLAEDAEGSNRTFMELK